MKAQDRRSLLTARSANRPRALGCGCSNLFGSAPFRFGSTKVRRRPFNICHSALVGRRGLLTRGGGLRIKSRLFSCRCERIACHVLEFLNSFTEVWFPATCL